MKSTKKIILVTMILSFAFFGSYKGFHGHTKGEILSYQFTESFDTQTYLDTSATTALGWGGGNLSVPLKNWNSMIYKSAKRDGNIFINGSGIGVMNSDAGSIGIYNFSNPLNPIELAQKYTPWTDEALFLYKDHVYIASGGNGVGIIDIRDLSNLSDPLYVPTSLNANDLVVERDFVFVVDKTNLAIFNITDPVNPGPVIYQTADTADHIAVYNGFAYMTCRDRIGIVDVSDPTNPSGIFYRDGFGGYTLEGIHITNDLAFVAVDHGGLAIFNVSDSWNPSVPVLIDTGFLNIIDVRPSDILVYGDVAILVISDTNNDYCGLVAIDVSELNDLKTMISIELNLYQALNLAIFNDYLYVTGRDIVNYQSEPYVIITYFKDVLKWDSPVIAQTSSIHYGGKVRNVTVQSNELVGLNSSITHHVSFDKRTWYNVSLNETHSFTTNTDFNFYWRVVLFTEVNETTPPIIYEISIQYDVYYSATTTSAPTTAIIPPGETRIFDFSILNIYDFSFSTSLSAGSTQINLNNLQSGRNLQIIVSPRPNLRSTVFLLSNSGLQSEITWQLINPQGFPKLAVTQSAGETTTRSITIDASGSWSLLFQWDDSIEATLFDCQVTFTPVSGNPQSINPDPLFLPVLIFTILLSIVGIILYRSVPAWRREQQKRAIKPPLQKPSFRLDIKKSGKEIPKTQTPQHKVQLIRQKAKQDPVPLQPRVKTEIPSEVPILIWAIAGMQILMGIFSLSFNLLLGILILASGILTIPAYSQNMEARRKRERESVGLKAVNRITLDGTIPEPIGRISFFCQLDNLQHPKTTAGYQCQNCSRMVCADCYEKSIKVGVPECPFCDGPLKRIQ
ncbi:MAG: LVIVD repeat-containing protein [Candidatus Thorarchaeota archaeon]